MTEETQVVPALDTLAADQQELFEDLERGFDSRADIVLWCHKASARTLGQLPDRWAAQLLGNRYQVAALLDDPRERDSMMRNSPDDRKARIERQVLGDDELLEACRKGMAHLSKQANELHEPQNVGDQKWLAMRPALHDLVSRQRASLKRVLGRGDRHAGTGLETHEDVSQWVRGVIRATKGVDGGITQNAVWDLWWRRALTGDVNAPSLHLLLGEDVLTVMNRSIRETSTAARETVEEERVSHGSLST